MERSITTSGNPFSGVHKGNFSVRKFLVTIKQSFFQLPSETPSNKNSKEFDSETCLKEISESIHVSEAIIESVLARLTTFEKERKYLRQEVNLNDLAKSLGTNHAYLSRIINHVKGKSFKKYLNDLRLEYAYIDLQTDLTKRRYTIEAIAFENGFKSAESFSRKFKQHYGEYPSQFLRKLKESA